MAKGLLISRLPVRLHELALVSSWIGNAGTATFRELHHRFVCSSGPIDVQASGLMKELLGFLSTLGMLKMTNHRRWEDRSFTYSGGTEDFGLTLLKRINRHTDVRQRAIYLLHEQLTRRAVQHANTQEVLALMESNYGSLGFVWNEAKITFATKLLADLGLITYLPPGRIAMSPASQLLLKAIPAGRSALADLLGFVDRDLFSVFTSQGNVHEGVARALLRLANQGDLRLSYQSDSRNSLVLAGRRVSILDRTS